MNEPTTALTDYVLALLAAILGARMLRPRPGRFRPEEREPNPSRARRLWAFSFLAVAAAAALGGTWHALAPETSSSLRGGLWSATYLAAGVANLLMLVGLARAALLEETQPAAIGLMTVVIAAFTALTLWRRDLPFVGAGFGITMLLVLAFGLVLQSYRERGAGFMIAGALVSLAGGFLILLRFGLHPQFNHNDFFHVIQMAAMGLLYKAGLHLRDR